MDMNLTMLLLIAFVSALGGGAGGTYGALTYFDGRIRAQGDELAKLRYQQKHAQNSIGLLTELLRGKGFDIPASAMNVEAQGDVNIGGDVTGRDKVRGG